MALVRVSLTGLAIAALVVGGCGGKIETNDDLVISDSQGSLSGPETAGDEDDGDTADRDCRDGDHEGHKHHRKHWFKVLDRLDGAKDGAITIASLPSGLPDRLIAKLHRIDKNGDGVVTRKEVKHARKHRGDRDRDDNDNDNEQEGEHEDDD